MLAKQLTIDELRAKVRPFATPSDARGWLEVGITLTLFFILLISAGIASAYSTFIAILISGIAGFVYVRVFVLQHDCGHRSLFANRTLNIWVGKLMALVALTPFRYWSNAHLSHHQNSGRLDVEHCEGAMLFLTTKQYGELSRFRKLQYRIYYFPLVLFCISPTLLFAGYYRCFWVAKNPKERRSMLLTNLSLAIVFGSLCFFVGWKALLIAYAPAVVVGSTIGVWLFYIQHIFEKAYFAHDQEYDRKKAIVSGSSYYRLPTLLDWVTGYIGYHSLHHLNPSIPSYRLKQCWEATKGYFAETPSFTLSESTRLIGFALWDDQKQKMIRFSDLPRTA